MSFRAKSRNLSTSIIVAFDA